MKVQELWERMLKQLADRLEGPDRNADAPPELIAGQKDRG